MKLRIRGDSIRLRVTQADLDSLRKDGVVEEVVHFWEDQQLVYALQASEEVGALVAHFEENRVVVLLRADWIDDWIDSDQVGFDGEQVIDDEHTLSLLIEKDFKCLHRPPGVEDEDSFPHPLAETAEQ